MKPYLLYLGLTLLTCGTARHAKGAEQVKTAVEKATLFLNGAQVTRTKQLDLPAGETTLIFTGLSPYLDTKSLQVTAKGKLTILGVERVYDYADSLERTHRQQQLAGELETIDTKAKRTAAELENIQAEMKLLEINCSAGTRTADVPLTAIKELTDYYAAQLRKLKTRQLELQEQQMQLQEHQRQLRKESIQIGGSLKNPMSRVEVKVETNAPCQATFSLVYYVKNAGWHPCYDIRSAGLDAPVVLSCKANIYQNTREEWKDVELTLSSSNPTTGNVAPELQTYWLDYGLPAPRYDLHPRNNTVSGTVCDATNRTPIIGATVAIPGTTIGTVTDIDGRYSITLPNGASELEFSFVGMETATRHISGQTLNVMMKPDTQSLDEVVVTGYGIASKKRYTGSSKSLMAATTTTVESCDFDEAESETLAVERARNQMGYEFAIRRPYTVPSDGKPVAVEIGRYELPATYVYRCTPKIDKDAFLLAETTGSSKYNLLEGEASVYFENTFVGKSILTPDPTNDTLRFSMGRDHGIVVKREKERDYTSQHTIGSNRTQTMGWLLTVHNTRHESVKLTLCDQLPVSRNSDITVTAEELSGGHFDPDKNNGTVTWELHLAPGEQRDLRLRYKVKYPKGRDLAVE